MILTNDKTLLANVKAFDAKDNVIEATISVIEAKDNMIEATISLFDATINMTETKNKIKIASGTAFLAFSSL